MSTIFGWLAADCSYCSYDLQYSQRGDPLSRRQEIDPASRFFLGNCPYCFSQRLERIWLFDAGAKLAQCDLMLMALEPPSTHQQIATWWLNEHTEATA